MLEDEILTTAALCCNRSIKPSHLPLQVLALRDTRTPEISTTTFSSLNHHLQLVNLSILFKLQPTFTMSGPSNNHTDFISAIEVGLEPVQQDKLSDNSRSSTQMTTTGLNTP